MFRLFRGIRQKLINDAKFGKYMLYAIGEVLILIFGILIAMQVDNWNENRQNEDLETVILMAIKADLDKDLINCKNDMLIHEAQIKSSNIILTHLDNDLSYNDTLSIHFLNTCNYTINADNNASFETLKSLGVGLISNVALRNRIIYMYDAHQPFLSQLRKTITDLLNNAQNHLFSIRFEEGLNYFDEGLIHESIKLGENLESIENPEGSGRMIPVNFESLKSDQEYLYFLKTTKNANKIYLGTLYDFETRLSELNSTIELEIEQLER